MSLEGFQGTWYSLIACFRVVDFSISGKVTNVYGPRNARDKKDFLISLGRLWEGMAIPIGWWEVISTSLPLWRKKKGGRRRLEEECETFRETIEDLRLVDIIPGE